jgi:hypothetical protein
MIRHVVLLRFRPDVGAAARAGLMAELDALRARLPGMLSFAAHRNVSVEAAVMHGFDDGFVVDLADAAARDAYLADPEHRAIGARLVAACVGGTDGLVVFDHAV